jgi:hypothetical protein
MPWFEFMQGPRGLRWSYVMVASRRLMHLTLALMDLYIEERRENKIRSQRRGRVNTVII